MNSKTVDFPCLLCRKTTGIANKSSAGTLQSRVCDLWAHYECCTGLLKGTLEAYDCYKPLKFSSCKSALNKFNSDLNAMKVRMNNLESKQQETRQKIETFETWQACSDTCIAKKESRLDNIGGGNIGNQNMGHKKIGHLRK